MAFTLVELMVAVAVFSIGIVCVLKSFLGITAALEVMQNRGEALEILVRKMNDWEQESREQGGIKSFSAQEEFPLRQRSAVLYSEIRELKAEELREPVSEIVLSLSWRNDSRNEEEIIASYFPYKKQ